MEWLELQIEEEWTSMVKECRCCPCCDCDCEDYDTYRSLEDSGFEEFRKSKFKEFELKAAKEFEKEFLVKEED